MQVVAVLQANVRSFVAQQGEILSDRNKWKALMKLVHGLQTQLSVVETLQALTPEERAKKLKYTFLSFISKVY